VQFTETCDAGPLNGTGTHDEGFVACSATCGLEARRIVVSSKLYGGNLGGLSGADLLCQNLVLAAGWTDASAVRAWLSNATDSPLSRFVETRPSLPFSLINGRRVAGDLADLAANGPDVGISLDELGAAWTEQRVWTNTSVTGGVFSPVDHCAGWLAASPDLVARIGINAVAEAEAAEWAEQRRWTSMASWQCSKTARLYCLEL